MIPIATNRFGENLLSVCSLLGIIKGQNDQYDGADLFLTRTLFGDNIFILHVTMEFAKAMSIAWRLLQHLRFGLSLGWTQR